MRGGTEWNCFTRTFMELKDGTSFVVKGSANCFTRTFMELKGKYGWICFSVSEFYSHLYGIERSYRTAQIAWRNSFTRTFMELKGR